MVVRTLKVRILLPPFLPMYDVWCMMYDGWWMMYDVWCMMYDVWCMMYDVWCMMYDVWCMMMMYDAHTQTPKNLFLVLSFEPKNKMAPARQIALRIAVQNNNLNAVKTLINYGFKINPVAQVRVSHSVSVPWVRVRFFIIFYLCVSTDNSVVVCVLHQMCMMYDVWCIFQGMSV